MNYSIQVLKMGEAHVPGPEVYWMSHWGEWETLFFYMVVIRGNGITAVVNTGPPSNLSPLNHAWKQFAGERCQLTRLEEERPERALEKIGVRPEEVDYVLLTPLQAMPPRISLFSPMPRYVLIEDIVARLPYVHVLRSLCISDDVLKYLMFEAWDRVRPLDDEEEICPGITAWWLTHITGVRWCTALPRIAEP